ncbi:MAG TPA: histidine kinase dimerization/phospho-acceptor domain-containing protein, partial [Propionicimonas sp.]|nr:histidine kinase dimerization/phospho-acceptor domain-containing protein [Propionicimonas sp.]
MRWSVRANPYQAFVLALGGALGASAVFAALLLSDLPQTTKEAISSLGFVVGGLAIVVNGLLAARRGSGRRRRAWLVLVAAAGSAMAGSAVTTLSGGDPIQDTSPVGDALVALALVLTVFGLLGLSHQPLRRANVVVTWLDGIVVGCAVLILGLVLVFSRIVESGTLNDPVKALLFPALDITVLTVALLLILRSQGDRGYYTLIGVAFVLYAIGDLSFAVQNASGTYSFGTVQDLAWITGYLLLAASAWHPAAATPTSRADLPAQSADHFDVQGTLLTFGLLVTAAAAQVLSPGGPLRETLTALWVVLVFTVGVRQTLLIKDNQSLREGLEQRVREQTADLRSMARQNEVLLVSVGDGIYAVDLEGRITSCNPSTAHAIGCEPEQLIGRPAHEVLHVAPAVAADGLNGAAGVPPHPWAACYIHRALTEAQVARQRQDVYRRTDGTFFPVELTASPMLSDDRVTGAVVVFRDVTQRREIEQMKDQFLSTVSHELRTPLTSIRGSLGMLGTLSQTSPEQAQRTVTIALRSCERLIRLINDILDVERIRSGKLRMERTPLEVHALLTATVRELTPLAQEHGIAVHLEQADGWVVADADRITQTLTNIVGNAMKFAPPGT